MRLHFKHMTFIESVSVIIGGFAFFIISGYIIAIIKFVNIFF